MSVRIIASTIGCCAMLAACGQRGALYLPDEGRNVVVTPAAVPATAEPAVPATPATEEEQRRKNAAAPAK
jgi:predicted small lipoprotein YifL